MRSRRLGFFEFLLICIAAMLVRATASSACDRKRVMVAVSAARALPVKMTVFVLNNLNLTIKATSLAIVRLGVQLSVHTVVVNMLNNFDNGFDIVHHRWQFCVTYRSTE